MARRPVLGEDKPVMAQHSGAQHSAAQHAGSHLPGRVRVMALLAWVILLIERLWAALTPAGAILLLALALAR